MVAFFYVAQFIIQNGSLFLFGNLVIGVVLWAFGTDSRTGWKRFVLRIRVSVLLLIGTIVLAHTLQAFFQSRTEWCPDLMNRSLLTGTWVQGSHRLEINDDGTASHVVFERIMYLWHIEGCKLVFTDGVTRLQALRIIRFNGEYRIMYYYDKNAVDFFRGELGFGRVRPCRNTQLLLGKRTSQMVVLFYVVWFIMRATFLFLLANLMIGLMLCFGTNPRAGWKRFVLRIPVSVLLLVGALVLANGLQAFFESRTEWCPEPINKDVLVGTWRKGADRLQLNDEGTAFYVAREQDKFSWHIEGYELVLTDMHQRRLETWRIIRFNGEYRILDDYDKGATELVLSDLGFSRIQE